MYALIMNTSNPSKIYSSNHTLSYKKMIYHLKFNFQLNPPQVISEAVIYSNVSSDITSIIGQTTVFRSAAIRAKSGSNHPSEITKQY